MNESLEYGTCPECFEPIGYRDFFRHLTDTHNWAVTEASLEVQAQKETGKVGKPLN